MADQRNFVSPYGGNERRQPAAVRVYREASMAPAPHDVNLPSPIVAQQSIVSSAKDRAWAFNISTAGLAAIFGFGGLLIAVAGWGVPLVSVAALTVFALVAAGMWLIAWVWFNAASPDGIGLLTVLLHYRLLRHEQRARLDRIDSMMGRDEQ